MRGLGVWTIRDGEQRAFLLRGVVDQDPVVIVESDEPQVPGFAVVADSGADVAQTLLGLQRILGDGIEVVAAPHLVSAAG